MRNASSHPLIRAAIALALLATSAQAQLRREGVSALTDAEFWQLFTTMSEVGGSFPSENFVSNEMTYQHVIPELQKTVSPNGVYLGVGPEQNFTYIANLKPRLAIIFDIRRQNAMAHLMYKAVFEMSPTRGEFISRLFSRPLAGRVAAGAKVDDMFAVAAAAQPSDSAYVANQHAIFANLVNKHHFALTPGDSAAIEHLLEVFYEAGPDLNYGYRLGRRGTSYSTYATYGTLQTRTNADSVQMAFLANEENYRVVRDMQVRNLIVPAFYLSNVEQYLFQNGVADQFYQNVSTLPIDSGSTFIRSVPPGYGGIGGGGGFTFSQRIMTSAGGAFTANSIAVYDSAGVRWMQVVLDSAGLTINRIYRDSAGVLSLQKSDTARTPARVIPMPNPAPWPPRPYSIGRPAPVVMVGGGLVSGIASMKKTVDLFKAGNATAYQAIISMTKLDGWK